jgi:arginyl-tRNA synthetase
MLSLWTGGDEASLVDADLSPLTAPSEMALLATLAGYPEMLARAQVELSPHQVAFYLRELAANLHSFYFAEKVLVEDEAIKHARLALVLATRQVLRNGLAMIGVSAPEQM